MDISDHRVKDAPCELFYIPNFITEEQEEFLINKVNSAPKPKWVQLMNRRLQNWGGSPTKNGMILEAIPSWLQMFMDRVNELDIFDNSGLKTNHVLINEYTPGQGIMPHEDGPMFYPTIATITCGSGTILKFERKSSEMTEGDSVSHLPQSVQVYLERRSLVVVRKDLYQHYLHSIEERTSDQIDSKIANLSSLAVKEGETFSRDTRLSLTIRHVLKVSKIKFKFGRFTV